MSTVPPPPLPPSTRPKPPGLGAGQKALIGLAIVLTMAITALSFMFIVWTQRATQSNDSQFQVFEDAKKRQAARLAEYNDALAGLPNGTLPDDWSSTKALRAFDEDDDLTTIQDLAEMYLAGGNRFVPLDLVQLARTIDYQSDSTDFAKSIRLGPFTSDAIEQRVLTYLRESQTVNDLCLALRNGIYFVNIDPVKESWGQKYGDDGVPDRYGPAMVLALRAQLEARWGELASAIQAYMDAVQFAELLGNDPHLSYHELSYQVEWRADTALWELTQRWDLPEDASQQIQAALARRADTKRLKDVIYEDVELQFPRAFGADQMDNNPFISPIARMMGAYDPEKAHYIATTLASFVDKPYSDMRDFVGQLMGKGDRGVLGNVPYSALYAREQQLRATMTADALQLALALKRFKSVIGSYPSTLEPLIPAYVAEIPNDPVTGLDVEYLPWADGYFLFVPGDEDDEDYDDDDYYGYGYTPDMLWHAEQ